MMTIKKMQSVSKKVPSAIKLSKQKPGTSWALKSG